MDGSATAAPIAINEVYVSVLIPSSWVVPGTVLEGVAAT
jgi:hypothetical protein